MLHTPIYDVRWREFCGPTAIAAVTGEPLSVIREAIRTIREARGNIKTNGHAMPIMGLSNADMLGTMSKLGWKVIDRCDDTDNKNNRRDIFRFGDFLDYVQMHEHEGPYIVNVTGHYYAVDADEICDTATQIPIEIHRFKRGRRCWVKCWWQFSQSGS